MASSKRSANGDRSGDSKRKSPGTVEKVAHTAGDIVRSGVEVTRAVAGAAAGAASEMFRSTAATGQEIAAAGSEAARTSASVQADAAQQVAEANLAAGRKVAATAGEGVRKVSATASRAARKTTSKKKATSEEGASEEDDDQEGRGQVLAGEEGRDPTKRDRKKAATTTKRATKKAATTTKRAAKKVTATTKSTAKKAVKKASPARRETLPRRRRRRRSRRAGVDDQRRGRLTLGGEIEGDSRRVDVVVVNTIVDSRVASAAGTPSGRIPPDAATSAAQSVRVIRGGASVASSSTIQMRRPSGSSRPNDRCPHGVSSTSRRAIVTPAARCCTAVWASSTNMVSTTLAGATPSTAMSPSVSTSIVALATSPAGARKPHHDQWGSIPLLDDRHPQDVSR